MLKKLFGLVVPLFNERDDFGDAFYFDAIRRIDVSRVKQHRQDADGASANNVCADDVADVDAGFGRFTGLFEGYSKDRGVGFLDADEFGVDDEIQILGESGFFQETCDTAVGVGNDTEYVAVALEPGKSFGRLWGSVSPQVVQSVAGAEPFDDFQRQFSVVYADAREHGCKIYLPYHVVVAVVAGHVFVHPASRFDLGVAKTVLVGIDSRFSQFFDNLSEIKKQQRVACVEENSSDLSVAHNAEIVAAAGGFV